MSTYFGTCEDIDYADAENKPECVESKVESKIDSNLDNATSDLSIIKEMFPDRESHLGRLVRIFKFINDAVSDANKPIYEKTKAEVISEVIDSEFSLDVSKMLNKQQNDAVLKIKRDKVLIKQIAAIPAFIDFAFIYYIQHYSKTIPVYKFPIFLAKLRMLLSVIKADNVELSKCFKQCIENKTIAAMRVETPPYHLRVEISKEEIRKQLKEEVLPVLKNILEHCLKLDTRT